jgi:hypothetical protein
VGKLLLDMSSDISDFYQKLSRLSILFIHKEALLSEFIAS